MQCMLILSAQKGQALVCHCCQQPNGDVGPERGHSAGSFALQQSVLSIQAMSASKHSKHYTWISQVPLPGPSRSLAVCRVALEPRLDLCCARPQCCSHPLAEGTSCTQGSCSPCTAVNTPDKLIHSGELSDALHRSQGENTRSTGSCSQHQWHRGGPAGSCQQAPRRRGVREPACHGHAGQLLPQHCADGSIQAVQELRQLSWQEDSPLPAM